MWRQILKMLTKDDLQVQALNECYEMLDLCHEMVTASVESLRNREDASVDVDVYETDRKLNAFERDVRRKVMTHLAVGHPEDISSGLSLVSIVVDIERIGDYSKNICDLAMDHPGRLHGGPVEDDLRAVERKALEHFDRTVSNFKRGDIEEARRLMSLYKEDISGQCSAVVKSLVTGKADVPAPEAAALALYLRFLKRISAHSRNLVSSLVNPFHRIGYHEKREKR
ncbi:MAG: PhoU domain-containing protein [Planctomycetota bacterium]